MSSSLAKTLKLALLGCVIALGAARTADAAYVVINADPAYGPALPNLGWRASGAIYVPDACLQSGPTGGNAPNVFPFNGNCATIQMQDVKVFFYDLGAPQVTIETLSIGTYQADPPPPDGALDITQKLRDVDFDSNGDITDFKSSLSFQVQAFHPLAGGPGSYFSLEFSRYSSRLVNYRLVEGAYVQQSSSQVTPGVTLSEYIADSVYLGTVPEPGSMALTLAALAAAFGVGGLARRSRA